MSGSRPERDDSEFDERLKRVLEAVERMASGELDLRIPISEHHDTIDALAHAINVIVGDRQHLTTGLLRAKEQAEAANLAKTEFLRNVSHELRTPLTVVLGLSELIASRDSPEQRRMEYRDRIARKGQALVGILDDLQDLARVEAARLELELCPLSVADVLVEVAADFESQAADKGVQFAVETADDPAPALADEQHVRQILTNLIGNAVKFTSQGRVAVRAGADEETRTVWAEVMDTGIGMSEDQTGTVFEPFVQGDASIAERFGGTGLGLALSKRLAEAMNGALDLVASAPGAGTTFRLILPAAEPGARGCANSGESASAASDLRGMRVLVADDNEEVRGVTSALLRTAGATVVEVADGQEVLEVSDTTAFHRIVMDLRMPRVDGLEATRRLRQAGVSAPVVALTAYATAEQRDACLRAGCSDYLTKPIDQARLVRLLARGDGAAPESG